MTINIQPHLSGGAFTFLIAKALGTTLDDALIAASAASLITPITIASIYTIAKRRANRRAWTATRAQMALRRDKTAPHATRTQERV